MSLFRPVKFETALPAETTLTKPVSLCEVLEQAETISPDAGSFDAFRQDFDSLVARTYTGTTLKLRCGELGCRATCVVRLRRNRILDTIAPLASCGHDL